MRLPIRWNTLLFTAMIAGIASCSGGDDDPVDPGSDTGSVRATVTADGDPLPAVTVRLFANGGASALASAATAANGQVTFGSLDPGSYDIDVVVPAGFELETGEALRRDVVVEADETATVTFGLAEIVIPPTEGQVRARVVEAGVGVQGVDVMLFATGGVTPIETGTTGADGRILFDALVPGTFDVGIELPADFEVAEGDTVRKAVTVTAGVTTDVQFGIVSTLQPATEITASGSSFTPADVTVEPGTTVRWIKGSNPHTVTPSGHNEWTEVTLDQTGETFEHTFDNVGTFNYLCEIHDGMTGVIRVQN